MLENRQLPANLLTRMLYGWHEIDPNAEGRTVAEALRMLADWPDQYSTLREALAEFRSAKDSKLPSNRSIGMKLHHWEKRFCGDRCFESELNRQGVKAWKVVKADEHSGN